jgi:hypothetical protein
MNLCSLSDGDLLPEIAVEDLAPSLLAVATENPGNCGLNSFGWSRMCGTVRLRQVILHRRKSPKRANREGGPVV